MLCFPNLCFDMIPTFQHVFKVFEVLKVISQESQTFDATYNLRNAICFDFGFRVFKTQITI